MKHWLLEFIYLPVLSLTAIDGSDPADIAEVQMFGLSSHSTFLSFVYRRCKCKSIGSFPGPSFHGEWRSSYIHTFSLPMAELAMVLSSIVAQDHISGVAKHFEFCIIPQRSITNFSYVIYARTQML